MFAAVNADDDDDEDVEAVAAFRWWSRRVERL